MELFLIDDFRFGQHWVMNIFRILDKSVSELLVRTNALSFELLLRQFKRITKLNRDFLLFLENVFVVLHVIFCVCFKVASEFV